MLFFVPKKIFVSCNKRKTLLRIGLEPGTIRFEGDCCHRYTVWSHKNVWNKKAEIKNWMKWINEKSKFWQRIQTRKIKPTEIVCFCRSHSEQQYGLETRWTQKFSHIVTGIHSTMLKTNQNEEYILAPVQATIFERAAAAVLDSTSKCEMSSMYVPPLYYSCRIYVFVCSRIKRMAVSIMYSQWELSISFLVNIVKGSSVSNLFQAARFLTFFVDFFNFLKKYPWYKDLQHFIWKLIIRALKKDIANFCTM